MRRDLSQPDVWIRLDRRGMDVNIPGSDSFTRNPLLLRLLQTMCLPCICVNPDIGYFVELPYATRYLKRYIRNKETHAIHVRETSDFEGTYYILTIRTKDEILNEIIEQQKRQRCMGV